MDKKKILIIEDDKQLADMIKSRLSTEGFETEAIYDGRGAIENILVFKPNLILLDIKLPGKDGRDVLTELKKDDDLKVIPVVIISGKDQQFDRTLGLELGAVDYIIKPFSLVLLSTKIKKLLGFKAEDL